MRFLVIISTFVFIISAYSQTSEYYTYSNNGEKANCYVYRNGEIKVDFFNEQDRLYETGFFKGSLKHRSWLGYDTKGHIAALANYKDGEKDGKWLIWDKDGNIRYEIHYRNNKITSAYELDENGLTVAEVHR